MGCRFIATMLIKSIVYVLCKKKKGAYDTHSSLFCNAKKFIARIDNSEAVIDRTSIPEYALTEFIKMVLSLLYTTKPSGYWYVSQLVYYFVIVQG